MNKKLLGAPGIATRSKKLLGAPGRATRSKKLFGTMFAISNKTLIFCKSLWPEAPVHVHYAHVAAGSPSTLFGKAATTNEYLRRQL